MHDKYLDDNRDYPPFEEEEEMSEAKEPFRNS
jgi:hypothetical protein